jgi:hypothetical protein
MVMPASRRCSSGVLASANDEDDRDVEFRADVLSIDRALGLVSIAVSDKPV